MKTRITHCLLFLCLPFLLFSSADFQPSSSEMSLRQALQLVEKQHQVKFSYSESVIDLEATVELTLDAEDLAVILDNICEQAHLEYQRIGSHIVLRPEDEPKDNNHQLQNKDIGFNDNPADMRRRSNRLPPYPVLDPIPRSPVQKIGYSEPVESSEEVILEGLRMSPYESVNEDNLNIAQVSLIPQLGTNGDENLYRSNKLSLNILWGHNGGVNGTEIGGLMNTVEHEMTGVQIAGLSNHVKGDVNGVQIGGLLNRVDQPMKGVQITGGLNISKDKSYGFQFAGLGNISQGHLHGHQLSGLFNVSRYADSQVSGLFNAADTIGEMQASFLINKARQVNGTQLGVINICDTTTGVAFGLLSIVNKGYNFLELGYSDIEYASMSFKLGTFKFYNIFSLGVRPAKPGGWYFGYGFGTFLPVSKKSGFAFDLTMNQLNEDGVWTDYTNFLWIGKTQFQTRLFKKGYLFVSPTFYTSLSNRRAEESNELLGTAISNYSVWESKEKNTFWKGWIGGQVGIMVPLY